MRDNVTATQEQYRLAEIPAGLGFPADRILVVDEDLGVSGHTIAGRRGMLRILGMLERGEVACVVVRDVGRLTRDEFNTDIGLIARACYHAGAVIITPEKTYDPADSSDQFLLGLQGLLAGWDRGQTVRRLAYHRAAKQAHGVNINGAVPSGFEKITDVPKTSPQHGKLCITKDPEVRERITLVLRKGLELRGVLAVLRFFRDQSLELPIIRGEEHRIVTGADGVARTVARGCRSVQWVEATRDRITRILKNPTYAGAIVNSRRRQVVDPTTGRQRWETRRAYADCKVFHDAHERYISWEEHLELLRLIAQNNHAKTYGKGEALLSGLGLMRCGVCGSRMVVQYNNPSRRSRGRLYQNTPYVYACTRKAPDGRSTLCQNPAGPHIDRAAAEIVLFALGRLDLDGVKGALDARGRRAEEARQLRMRGMDALERRAQMLEAAIAEATTAEARGRLVVRFEEALSELAKARAAVDAGTDGVPAISPYALARLEVFRDPAVAWARFTHHTRKEVIRALTKAITIHPDVDGYFVVMDWEAGGRAAAKVQTTRRRKVYPVPEDVLALFDEGIAGKLTTRRVAGRLERAPRDGRG